MSFVDYVAQDDKTYEVTLTEAGVEHLTRELLEKTYVSQDDAKHAVEAIARELEQSALSVNAYRMHNMSSCRTEVDCTRVKFALAEEDQKIGEKYLVVPMTMFNIVELADD